MLAEDWNNWPNPLSRFWSQEDKREEIKRKANALGLSQAVAGFACGPNSH
jgi:hypothetical protein